MRAPPIASVAPDETGQAALDTHLIGPVTLRLVPSIGGIEADHLPFAAEGLERRFGLVDERDHDLSLARRVDAPDQREVAVEDALLDHRVAGYFECIMFTWSEQRRGNGERLAAL